MSDEHTNPYAFPLFLPSEGRVDSAERGMTLRDYFAGQALAMLADPDVMCGTKQDQRSCAYLAYALADAMLAERAKEPKS